MMRLCSLPTGPGTLHPCPLLVWAHDAFTNATRVAEALGPVADAIRQAPKDGMAMGIAMKSLAGQPADSDDVKAVIAELRQAAPGA